MNRRQPSEQETIITTKQTNRHRRSYSMYFVVMEPSEGGPQSTVVIKTTIMVINRLPSFGKLQAQAGTSIGTFAKLIDTSLPYASDQKCNTWSSSLSPLTRTPTTAQDKQSPFFLGSNDKAQTTVGFNRSPYSTEHLHQKETFLSKRFVRHFCICIPHIPNSTSFTHQMTVVSSLL